MSKKVVYAIKKTEHKQYLNELLYKRNNAFTTLRDLLEDKEPDEWTTHYSRLCEYISVLFHLENYLEQIELTSVWDEDGEQWIMTTETATQTAVYISSEAISYRELLFHNTSLALH